MQSKIPNWIIAVIILLALIGFADSAYLFAKRLSGGPIPCFITSGCDTVSKSPYSVFLGVPLALWGAIFYLAIGFLCLLYWDTKKELFAKLVFFAGTLGFLSSLYFIYIQKFLIKAFCIYCIASATISTILFVLGAVVYRKLRKV